MAWASACGSSRWAGGWQLLGGTSQERVFSLPAGQCTLQPLPPDRLHTHMTSGKSHCCHSHPTTQHSTQAAGELTSPPPHPYPPTRIRWLILWLSIASIPFIVMMNISKFAPYKAKANATEPEGVSVFGDETSLFSLTMAGGWHPWRAADHGRQVLGLGTPHLASQASTKRPGQPLALHALPPPPPPHTHTPTPTEKRVSLPAGIIDDHTDNGTLPWMQYQFVGGGKVYSMRKSTFLMCEQPTADPGHSPERLARGACAVRSLAPDCRSCSRRALPSPGTRPSNPSMCRGTCRGRNRGCGQHGNLHRGLPPAEFLLAEPLLPPGEARRRSSIC